MLNTVLERAATKSSVCLHRVPKFNPKINTHNIRRCEMNTYFIRTQLYEVFSFSNVKLEIIITHCCFYNFFFSQTSPNLIPIQFKYISKVLSYKHYVVFRSNLLFLNITFSFYQWCFCADLKT